MGGAWDGEREGGRGGRRASIVDFAIMNPIINIININIIIIITTTTTTTTINPIITAAVTTAAAAAIIVVIFVIIMIIIIAIIIVFVIVIVIVVVIMIIIIVVVIIIIIVVVTIVIVIVIIIMGTSGAAPATSERASDRAPATRHGRRLPAAVSAPRWCGPCQSVRSCPACVGGRAGTHTAKSGSDPRPRPSSARSKSASQATPYGRRRAAVKTQPRVKRVRALSAAREEVGGFAHQSAT